MVGITQCAAFCAYALALWYGSTRIVAGAYTGARAPRSGLRCCCCCWADPGARAAAGVRQEQAGGRPGSAPAACRHANNARPGLVILLTTAAGGDVMSVLFAALLGGFALGQAAPNLQCVGTAGQAASCCCAPCVRLVLQPASASHALCCQTSTVTCLPLARP